MDALKAELATERQLVTQSRQELDAAQAALRTAQEAVASDMAALRKSHQQRLDSQRTEHEQAIKQLQAAEQATLNRQRTEHAKAVADAVAKVTAEAEEQKAALTTELNSLTVSLAAALDRPTAEADAKTKDAMAKLQADIGEKAKLVAELTTQAQAEAATRTAKEDELKAALAQLKTSQGRVEALQLQLKAATSTQGDTAALQAKLDAAISTHQQTSTALQAKLDAATSTHQQTTEALQAKLDAATSTHQQTTTALQTKLATAEQGLHLELERQKQQTQTLASFETEKRQTLAQLELLRKEKQQVLADQAKHVHEHDQAQAAQETLLRDMAAQRDQALKKVELAQQAIAKAASTPDASSLATISALEAKLVEAKATLADQTTLSPEVERLRQLLERHGLSPDQSLPESPSSSGTASFSASVSGSRPSTPNREAQRRAVDVLARVVGQRPDVSGRGWTLD